jgi:uncharacterized membrane protein YgcG
MKNAKTAVVLLSLLLVAPVWAGEYPKATGYVNDFSHVLSVEQGASLNAELVAFEKKTTVEIAVVTVPWLNGQSIEDYARGLATEWGVGKRGQNNGIVFLIALKERKMRIEVASGAQSVLTNDRADQIRDEAILPQFRSGNMAQGIIDGTHAIVQAFEGGSAPIAGAESAPAPQSNPNDWTPEDTRILLRVLGTVLGIAVLLLLIVPPMRRANARKYVLAKKGVVAENLAETEVLAKNADVKEETRQELAQLKAKFVSIDSMNASDKVNWIKIRKDLDSIYRSGYEYYSIPTLISLFSKIKGEIAFGKKAREEGPKLMEQLPGILDAAEKKLAAGEQSEEAAKYIAEARTQYAQAQNQHSGMTVIDWVILYAILSSAQSNCANAESAHADANEEHSSSSSRSDDSDSSFGFGESGGFGGGGGFDGGGSSGSW